MHGNMVLVVVDWGTVAVDTRPPRLGQAIVNMRVNKYWFF
jgi:hypothetical protein